VKLAADLYTCLCLSARQRRCCSIAAQESMPPRNIPGYLGEIDLPEDALTFLVITHPDTDQPGGAGELARSYPHLRIMCGDGDRHLIESPEHLLSFRSDHYRQDHGIYYDDLQKPYRG
jgi:hypothetical protein